MLNQWLAEPVRHLWLPASTFIANAKGYPVLPKGTQSFIRDIMKVSGPSPPARTYARTLRRRRSRARAGRRTAAESETY